MIWCRSGLVHAIGGLALLAGCASVPPQSVQLSERVGQDLLAIKQGHVFYVNSFYDRLVFEANRAIDNEYTPALIAAELNGDPGGALMKSLEEGKAGGMPARKAVDFMEIFLSGVHDRVDNQRKMVLTPIQAARATAISQVESAYGNVFQANTTITAYLTSLRKLREAQDAILAKAAASNLQDRIAQTTATTSDEIDALLTRARRGEATVDQVTQTLEKLSSGTPKNPQE
jgi:hypothetical protein